MALTVVASNTTTPTVGTPTTLDTETPAQAFIYQLMVDASAMVGGATPDELVLTIKAAVLASGALQIAQVGTYRGVQGQPIKLSIPVPVAISASIEFDLLQSAGTARAFPWCVWHL